MVTASEALNILDKVAQPIGSALAIIFNKPKLSFMTHIPRETKNALEALDVIKVFDDPFHQKTEKVGINEWTEKEVYEIIHGEVEW